MVSDEHARLPERVPEQGTGATIGTSWSGDYVNDYNLGGGPVYWASLAHDVHHNPRGARTAKRMLMGLGVVFGLGMVLIRIFA